MDYVPKHFQPYELVPRETYELLRSKPWKIWWLFDPRILLVGDRIRKRYGKMVANTWYWGGEHQYRGWRPWDCPFGAEFSQHKFGRALDLVPVEYAAEEIRIDIIKDGEDFGYVTCVEADTWWLHVDCRNYKGLLIVFP